MRKTERTALLLVVAAISLGVGYMLAQRVPPDSFTITTEYREDAFTRKEEAVPAMAVTNTPEQETETPSPSPTPEGPVNINTATAEELQTLKNIGPALAQRIVEYREEIGRFDSLEQLMEVKGIGEKIFEELKENITLG